MQLAPLKATNNELSEDPNKIMHLIIQLSTPGTRLSSMQLHRLFVAIHKYHEVLLNHEAVAQEADPQTVMSLEAVRRRLGGMMHIIEVIRSTAQLVYGVKRTRWLCCTARLKASRPRRGNRIEHSE